MKTRLQRQVGPECALVTIAMLAHKPIELIQRRVRGFTGLSEWSLVVDAAQNGDPQIFWDAIVYLVKFYHLEDVTLVLGKVIPESAKPHPQIVTSEAPALVGRGQLIFRHASQSHSVVVDDGYVYDGNLYAPMPLAKYWKCVMQEEYDATVYWTKLKTKDSK